MNVAVQGCFHGNCDEIFGTIKYIQQTKNIQIDVLLVCGDFQAMRNEYDMNTMACPPKYLTMGTFHKYYTGVETAPCLTIVIGGNHEASSHMRELYFGGWLAPNIYFLGYSGCIIIEKGGQRLTVGGISGIFSIPSFQHSFMESYPFDDKGKYSVYHQKQYDIMKLSLYTPRLDVFMSHDWPQGIYHHGNKKELIQKKRHFESDIRKNAMGSPPLKMIMNQLQPSYWFSGHMHVKFTAEYKHKEDNRTTSFLALDKCLPGRDFLQVLHFKDGKVDNSQLHKFKDPTPVRLLYSKEWLQIVKVTYQHLKAWNKGLRKYYLWNEAQGSYQSNFNQEELQTQIIQNVFPNDIPIPLNFKIVAYDPQEIVMNNQTRDFLDLIGESGSELNNFLYYDPRQRRDEFQMELKGEKVQHLTFQQQLQQVPTFKFDIPEPRDDRSNDERSVTSEKEDVPQNGKQQFQDEDLPFI